MVRVAGLEPACIAAADFKSAVYTIPPHPQIFFNFLKNDVNCLTYAYSITSFCVCVKCFLVLLTRIELVIALYQSAGIPFTYRSRVAGLAGVEPTTFVSKTKMISISPKTENWYPVLDSNLQPTDFESIRTTN